MTDLSSRDLLGNRKAVIDAFARRHRFKWYEAIPRLAALTDFWA